MSLWTCLKCTARRAVGLLHCPHCGHDGYAEGDTVSGAEGAQGQRQVPSANPQPAATAPVVVGEPGPELVSVQSSTSAAAAEPPAPAEAAPEPASGGDTTP